MIGKFLSRNKVGRWITARVHRHDGVVLGLRFMMGGGCWMCRVVTRDTIPPHVKQRLIDSLEDQSSIKISDPEDGKLGISTSAVAKRQYDEIIARDPERAKELQEAIENIRKKP